MARAIAWCDYLAAHARADSTQPSPTRRGNKPLEIAVFRVFIQLTMFRCAACLSGSGSTSPPRAGADAGRQPDVAGDLLGVGEAVDIDGGRG